MLYFVRVKHHCNFFRNVIILFKGSCLTLLTTADTVSLRSNTYHEDEVLGNTFSSHVFARLHIILPAKLFSFCGCVFLSSLQTFLIIYCSIVGSQPLCTVLFCLVQDSHNQIIMIVSAGLLLTINYRYLVKVLSRIQFQILFHCYQTYQMHAFFQSLE